MAEVTSFEQGAIDSAAKMHDQGQETMRSELKRVQGIVQNTLQSSNSAQTKALSDVYESWFRNVDQMIVSRCNDLTKSMRVTAEEQTASDETNASNMNSLNSFLS